MFDILTHVVKTHVIIHIASTC